jgi:hypothetical protein
MIDPELERTWAAAAARLHAPRGFEERLFARLAREAPVRAAAVVPEAMPWWVRAAGERHVALAFALAGAMLAWPAWWLRAAAPASAAVVRLGDLAEAGLAPWLTPVAQVFATPRVAAFAAPHVELALAAGLAPVLAWVSYRLARAIERRMLRITLKLHA